MLVHGSCLESSPPLCERLIKANEEGGDRERTHGQDPLIYSRSVIMWSGPRETEIEIQNDRQLYEKEATAQSLFHQSTPSFDRP